jgi:hypothetical protein
MPEQYTFQPKAFKCELKCQTCNFLVRPNTCCKVKVCIGIPYCRYHMQKAVKLEIKNSEHGKGVFAKADPPPRRGRNQTRNTGNRQLVFRSGEDIIEYNGEQITKDELEERYGKHTAPYALEMDDHNGIYEDGACFRSIGTVINHNRQRKNVDFSQTHNRSPITITATKNIFNGDQLYADYGDEYSFDENVVSKTTRTRKKGTVEPAQSECARTLHNRNTLRRNRHS